MEQNQQDERQKIVKIAQRHHIAYVAIFGSYARGDARPDSDVDLYVRFGRDTSTAWLE